MKATEGNLKKLKRAELLEMLVEIRHENEHLKEKVADLEDKLLSRQIQLEKAGSIAEAALVLNGVFDAAQKASQQYLDNIESLNKRQQEICEQKIAEAQKEAEQLIENAKKFCDGEEKESL